MNTVSKTIRDGQQADTDFMLTTESIKMAGQVVIRVAAHQASMSLIYNQQNDWADFLKLDK